MFEQEVNLAPGTGTYTQHTFEILIMLLGAFLLGLWLGWMLWNRFKQEADKLRLDNQSLMASFNALNTELNGSKAKLATSEASNLSLRSQVDKLTEENRIFRDQLTETGEDLVETEQRNRQLETELGLSYTATPPAPEDIPLEINIEPETPTAVLADEIPVSPTEVIIETPEPPVVVIVKTPSAEVTIVEGGISPSVEIPLAEEIQPTQEKPEATISIPAAEVIAPVSEAPPVIIGAVVGNEKDDLTVIEGIGPKIQELLYQYEIRTYRQLADAEVARLKEILTAAGPQLAMHDPGTWPSQANLAANDQWEQLKSIQGFLKGGKTPPNGGDKR